MGITNSFKWSNTWAEGAPNIPTGLILNVCLVTSGLSTVYMSNLDVSDGVLSVSFSQGGNIIAYGEGTEADGVLFLSTANDCSYAALELGSLQGVELHSTESVKISPSSILTTERRKAPKATVTVVQDGIEETAILADHLLRIDPRLVAVYEEDTKTVKIMLSATEHRSLLDAIVSVDPPIHKVTTVNHIRPNAEGFVDINISTAAGELSFTKSAKIPLVTISSDITPCASTDIIDRYIGPAVVRNFSYLPLDDAYTDGVRNTMDNLGKYNKLDAHYDSQPGVDEQLQRV